MSRRYTPSEIRDIGEDACPAIVESYDEVVPWISWASEHKDDIFGTHPGGPIWVSLFNLLKKAVDETPVSIGAMGRALVEIADRYDADEQDIEVDLEDSLAELEADFDSHRETIAEERAADAERRRRESEAKHGTRNGNAV